MLYIFILIVCLLALLVNYKEGLLQVNHALDMSGILNDKLPSTTKIQMITMMEINETEDPIMYNIILDSSIQPDEKVTILNEKIKNYFNPPQS